MCSDILPVLSTKESSTRRDPRLGQPPSLPIAYTDSEWAGAQTDRRRSVSGYIFTLAEVPISWKSRKQTCVALSSNETEYVAASEAARQATLIRRLITDMGLIDGEAGTMCYVMELSRA